MFRRGRRLRANSTIRSLVRENSLSVDDFIYPVFVVEGNNIKKEISLQNLITVATLVRRISRRFRNVH